VAIDDVGAVDAPDVPPWTRRFAYALIGVVLLCGLARLEAFPMSGFRLFSAIRHDPHESWQLRAVTDGEETPIVLADLPVAYRNTSYILRDFDTMSGGERDAVCRAWVQPAREDGKQVDFVRVYRVATSLRPDGPPPTRELRWECGRS
jgi:hypothetical protein